jgi:VanZ family protein
MDNELHYRKLWLTAGWLYVGFIVVMSLVPQPPQVIEFEASDKVYHFLAYFFMMTWFGQLYRRPRTRVIFFLLFECLGVGMEFLQAVGGERHFETADMLANTTGLAVGLIVVALGAGTLLNKLEQRLLLKR